MSNNDPLLINIAIPSVSCIKDMYELAYLENLLTSAINQQCKLAAYIQILASRVRELRGTAK